MSARSQNRAEAIIQILGEDGITELTKRIEKDFEDIAKRGKDTARATDGIGKSLLTVRERAALMVTGFNNALGLATQIIGAAKQIGAAIKEAGQSRAIEDQFNRTFAAASRVMDGLTAATAGQVDGTSLQKYAATLARAGVEQSKIAEVFELSIKAATATGREHLEVLDMVTKSIAEGTDEATKQLGVMIDLDAAYQDQALALGVTVGDLTKAQKAAGALEHTAKGLKDAFGAVDIEATDLAKVKQIEADWTNLTDTLTRGFADAAVEAARLVGLLEGPSGLGRAVKNASWTDWVGGIGAAAFEVARLNPLIDAAADHLSASEENWNEVAGSIHHTLNAMEGMEAALKAQQKAQQESIKTTGKTIEQRAKEKKALDDAAAARKAYEDRLRKAIQAEANAIQTTYRDAVASARLAAQMGHTTLATEKYQTAIEAAEKAGIGFVERERLKREAVIKTNAALLETLKVQAEVAIGAAQFLPTKEERDAAFLEATQLLDRYNSLRLGLDELVSENLRGDKAVPTEGNKGSGKRRPADIITAAQSGASRRGRDDTIDPLRQGRRGISTGDGTLEVIDKERAALAALASQMDATARSSLGMAEAMASSFGGVGGAVANASQIIVSQVDQISAVMAQFKDAGLDSSKAFVGAVPGMLAASGKLAAGFVGDQQTQAAIMAAMEGAAAVASFAIQDYYGGAMHLLSAGLYAAVAGGAFGGGGKGAGGGGRGAPQPRMPDVGIPNRDQNNGGKYEVVINMSGATIVGSDRRRLTHEMKGIISQAMQDAAPRGFNPA